MPSVRFCSLNTYKYCIFWMTKPDVCWIDAHFKGRKIKKETNCVQSITIDHYSKDDSTCDRQEIADGIFLKGNVAQHWQCNPKKNY